VTKSTAITDKGVSGVFSAHDRVRMLAKIQRYKNDCGCAAGAVMANLALLVCVILAVRRDWQAGGGIRFLLMAVGVIFVCGALGKLAGIGLARIKLQRLTRLLKPDDYVLPSDQQQ